MSEVLNKVMEQLPRFLKDESFMAELTEGLDQETVQLTGNGSDFIVFDSVFAKPSPWLVLLSLEVARQIVPTAKEAGVDLKVVNLPVYNGIEIPLETVKTKVPTEVKSLENNEQFAEAVESIKASIIKHLLKVGKDKTVVLYRIDIDASTNPEHVRTQVRYITI